MFSTESALQNSPLVLGFTPPVLAKLATYTSMLQYATDQAIITEGQPSENLFVLVKGQIVVEKVGSQGQRVLIAEVDQPGSFFGELALVDIQAHSATVRCSVASVFVVLPKAHLVDFFAEFPPICSEFLYFIFYHSHSLIFFFISKIFIFF